MEERDLSIYEEFLVRKELIIAVRKYNSYVILNLENNGN